MAGRFNRAMALMAGTHVVSRAYTEYWGMAQCKAPFVWVDLEGAAHLLWEFSSKDRRGEYTRHGRFEALIPRDNPLCFELGLSAERMGLYDEEEFTRFLRTKVTEGIQLALKDAGGEDADARNC